MALFQPTNIYPSSLGELGNGTVDVTQALNVSWQVNGNSAMTAFSITIYQNDAESTKVYETGKKTDGCPFYGTNYAGETVFFAYSIPTAALIGAGMKNGGEYKLVIAQWWGTDDAESVTQRSASVFITRREPTLSIEAIPSPLTARMHTFRAAYAQEQGDTLNWVRWQIADAAKEDDPFYDSGRIYGTAELRTEYDGFFSGTTYAVRCQIQTENGVQADSGWVTFPVEYSVAGVAQGAISLCIRKDLSGVLVSWPRLFYALGKANGNYTISGGTLILPEGSSVTWNEVTGRPMAFSRPWTILWRGMIWQETTVFTAQTDAGELSVTASGNGIKVLLDGAAVYTWRGQIRLWTEFMVAVSPQSVGIYQKYADGGLYPSETLYPSGTLYPRRSNSVSYLNEYAETVLDAQTIESLTLVGAQHTKYLQVIAESWSAEQMREALSGGNYTASFDANTEFLANFKDGLQAGNADLGETLTGFAIYRYDEGDATLRHIRDVPIGEQSIVDCGAASQREIKYYMFGLGADTFSTSPVISDSVTPCFWDWTILRCTKDENGDYHPQRVFRFGKNLSSGSVSNNNSPEILENFTRYPVIQPSPVNYESGSLSSLIGLIGKDWQYYDTNRMREEIFDLSTTQDTLFLKNRRGNLWNVRISGAITMRTMDNSATQAQTVTLPWAESGEADDVIIVLTQDDTLFPTERR